MAGASVSEPPSSAANVEHGFLWAQRRTSGGRAKSRGVSAGLFGGVRKTYLFRTVALGRCAENIRLPHTVLTTVQRGNSAFPPLLHRPASRVGLFPATLHCGR